MYQIVKLKFPHHHLFEIKRTLVGLYSLVGILLTLILRLHFQTMLGLFMAQIKLKTLLHSKSAVDRFPKEIPLY